MPDLHRRLGKNGWLVGRNAYPHPFVPTPPVNRTAMPEHSPILLHHPSQFEPNGPSTQPTAPTEETTDSETRGSRPSGGVSKE